MLRYALFKESAVTIFWFITGLPVVLLFLPFYLPIYFIGFLDELIGWLDLKSRPIEWKLDKIYRAQEALRRRICKRIRGKND